MEKKKVKTKGSVNEMAQYADVDQQTIQGAIELVENTANIEVEVPNEEK